jgi:hypothetical protein
MFAAQIAPAAGQTDGRVQTGFPIQPEHARQIEIQSFSEMAMGFFPSQNQSPFQVLAQVEA